MKQFYPLKQRLYLNLIGKQNKGIRFPYRYDPYRRYRWNTADKVTNIIPCVIYASTQGWNQLQLDEDNA